MITARIPRIGARSFRLLTRPGFPVATGAPDSFQPGCGREGRADSRRGLFPRQPEFEVIEIPLKEPLGEYFQKTDTARKFWLCQIFDLGLAAIPTLVVIPLQMLWISACAGIANPFSNLCQGTSVVSL